MINGNIVVVGCVSDQHEDAVVQQHAEAHGQPADGDEVDRHPEEVEQGQANDDGQQDWMATYFPLKLIVPF